MKLEGEKMLLRVYLRNTDKHGWFSPPAAKLLVERAKAQELARATVLRGIYGLDGTGRFLSVVEEAEEVTLGTECRWHGEEAISTRVFESDRDPQDAAVQPAMSSERCT